MLPEQPNVTNGISIKGMVERILKDHHEPTRKWIDEAKQLLRAAASEHPESDRLGKLGMAFQSLTMTMMMHMEKEEEILFPMLSRIEEGFNSERFCGGIENPIRVMENEHRELDLHLERIRRITNDYKGENGVETPANLRRLYEVLSALESDLKVHSRLEEQELFPEAVRREKGRSAQ